jgi:hypothetical protein
VSSLKHGRQARRNNAPHRGRFDSGRNCDEASFRRPRQMRVEAATCRQTTCEDAVTMSKPAKTEAELIAMARAELKVHVDCPDGIVISVIRDGDSWEFRATADDATIAKPGYPECVAMLVQIGDHLCKQYDFRE